MRLRRDVPLSPEVVDGWRAWSVIDRGGELRLSSLTRAEEWPPEEPFVAICDRHAHDPPARRCSCGVYAGSEPDELGGLGRIAGAAVGQVSLWGRIAQHRRGFRAEQAYPARLRLVCVACLAEGNAVPAVRARRERTSNRTRVVSLCDDHGGDATSPATDLEERLLETYRVEKLPDAALDRVGPQTTALRRQRWMAAAAAALVVLIPIATLAWVKLASGAPGAPGNDRAVSDAGGVELPFGRTADGYIVAPPVRQLLLTPEELNVAMCGKRTAEGVARVGCLDRRADVFVGDLVTADDPAGTCNDATVVTTRRGQRVFCWRPLVEI